MRGAHPGQPPWHNLAALGHELPEQTVILVVDVLDSLDAELADLLAAEEFAAALARRTAGATSAAEARTIAARAITTRTLRTISAGTPFFSTT